MSYSKCSSSNSYAEKGLTLIGTQSNLMVWLDGGRPAPLQSRLVFPDSLSWDLLSGLFRLNIVRGDMQRFERLADPLEGHGRDKTLDTRLTSRLQVWRDL